MQQYVQRTVWKGAVPWGRENGKCAWAIYWCVLLWDSEVCSVQRLKWQELVRMCVRKVQRASSYILDCELFVGLQSLKVGVLVAVVCCSDSAVASCNVVDTLDLNPGENMETWKQLILFFWISMTCCRCVYWCFRGMGCLHLQGEWVWFVCGMWGALLGLVSSWTSLLSAVDLTVDLKRGVHSLITHMSPPAHSYLLTFKLPFTSSVPTSVHLPLPTAQFQLAVHGMSTHLCPSPHSLLLALKRTVLEMLYIGSVLTLYFSPSLNCGWSDFLHLSQLFFAFQHFFSHWTSVSHREDGSSTFLPNVRTSTTRPFKYSTTSV